MASPREAIDTILKGDAALMALVKGVFTTVPAKREYPYIRYSNATGTPDYWANGVIAHTFERWQFDIFAERVRDCEAIKNRLIDLMNFLDTQVQVNGPADGVATCEILGSQLASFRDAVLDPDTQALHAVVDFRMTFRRA